MEAGLAPLLARALAAEPETSTDPTTDRILDAALAEAAASGIRRLTVDEVARRARIGRMTVYRRFGQRDRLVEALAVRECRRFLADVAAAAGRRRTPQERIAEAFAAGLRLARSHPLVSRVARSEPETIIEALLADDARVLEMGRAFIADGIRDVQRVGKGRAVDPERAAELLARVFFSFVLVPVSVIPPDDEEAARAFARELIVPIVMGGEG